MSGQNHPEQRVRCKGESGAEVHYDAGSSVVCCRNVDDSREMEV